ncbi:MAG: substrate-binding domain-containing protein [Bacteroidota bacterium]
MGSPIEINWLTPSQEDGQVQAQRILQAVNDRVDAILISCSDDQKVSDAIDDAVARGVAVMTFDSDAPRSRRFAYCGVDDFKVGEKVMAELAAVLPRRTKPAPKVAILAGNMNAPNLRRRVEGVMAEAARHPDLKVVGTFFHVETPQDASAEVLRAEAAYPDIAGWAMVGGWPLYNKTLLSDLDADAGRSRYKIVSVNALPPQLVYVEKGFAPVLLAQPTYLWGSVGVDTIVAKLLLKKSVPQLIPMQLVRVTVANLGSWARQLKEWGFGDVPEEYLRLK